MQSDCALQEVREELYVSHAVLVSLCFCQLGSVIVLSSRAVVFPYFCDQQLDVVYRGDMIADLEAQAGKRCIFGGVGSLLIDRGKRQRDAAGFNVDNDAEAELSVRVADPALSDYVVHQWKM